jgi:magnesium transporter
MQRDLIQVHTGTDQEEVAQLTARYDLLAIPVLDHDDKLVGIVTVDDIVDVVKEEATEDLFKMVGSSADELIYQDRSWRVAGIRLPWLLVNLVGGLLTGWLLAHFQFSFKESLFLLAFVPVIMGTGGNGGTQTSTITVRGLATGRIGTGSGRVLRFLFQQVKVGAFLGLATGVVVGTVAYFLQSNLYYGLVVAGALFSALILSSLTGALIPIVFQRLGVDPAVAAGPLVTTTSDITGILVYFGLAGLMIHRLVH